MRVAVFGNNLNQGYDIAELLVEQGIQAKVFDEQREFAQDTHTWYRTEPRNEDLIEHCAITQAELTAPGELSSWASIAPIYEKAADYDLLILREYGPALFSELHGPKKVFWPIGGDLQDLPFLARACGPRPWEKYSSINQKEFNFPEQSQGDSEPMEPYEEPRDWWARNMQERQRRGLGQCHCWIVAGYQFPLAQRLRYPTERLRSMPFFIHFDLRNDVDKPLKRHLHKKYADLDMVLFHPTRQLYVEGDTPWFKDNHKLFLAYHEFLKQATITSKLIAIDKGREEDLNRSRQLIHHLGIQDHVEWISELPNRELRAWYTLDNVVVCDQFSPSLPTMGTIGREATLFERPLITSYDASNNLVHGRDWPPNVFHAVSVPEILDALCYLQSCPPLEQKQMVRETRAWCQRFLTKEACGKRLVKLLYEVMDLPSPLEKPKSFYARVKGLFRRSAA